MSEEQNQERAADGAADAFAATAVITVIVLGMYLWLSGMPS